MSTPYAFTPHKYHPIGGGWIEHIPLAFTLLEILRPMAILELGVESGGSFFAWAQGIVELRLNARLVGVDWGGYFAADFFRREREKYPFVELIKGDTKDEAGRFANESFDIIHQDAGHSYEEVVRDLGLYIPKLKPRGIVLVHDTSMPEVRRAFDEIAGRYCRHGHVFDFPHSSGLGVLCPKGRPERAEWYLPGPTPGAWACPLSLDWLFNPANADAIRALFARIWFSYGAPAPVGYGAQLQNEYVRLVRSR